MALPQQTAPPMPTENQYGFAYEEIPPEYRARMGASCVTITLDPKRPAFKKPATKQHDEGKWQLELCLRSHTEEYVAVAELTQNGVVHYHLWVIFKKDGMGGKQLHMQQFIQNLRSSKFFGIYHFSPEITTDESQIKWTTYLFKSVKLTQKILKAKTIFRGNATEENEYLEDFSKEFEAKKSQKHLKDQLKYMLEHIARKSGKTPLQLQTEMDEEDRQKIQDIKRQIKEKEYFE